jgi:hypothetical protein
MKAILASVRARLELDDILLELQKNEPNELKRLRRAQNRTAHRRPREPRAGMA